jgi:hypothetical protein
LNQRNQLQRAPKINAQNGIYLYRISHKAKNDTKHEINSDGNTRIYVTKKQSAMIIGAINGQKHHEKFVYCPQLIP